MAAADDEPRPPPNGGSRPVPDPTVLTDRAIGKAIEAMRDYVDGQLSIRDERLRGIDNASTLRLSELDRMPAAVDEKVARLADLTAERFTSIVTQFRERDTRSERESRDNKVAVDAAFAAQKEAAAKQDEANSKAIDKSEATTIKTIDVLAKNLDETKERVTRVESMKAGATENRTGMYAGLAALGAVIGIVLAIAAVLATRSAP